MLLLERHASQLINCLLADFEAYMRARHHKYIDATNRNIPVLEKSSTSGKKKYYRASMGCLFDGLGLPKAFNGSNSIYWV